jgi:hypothetical protein
MERARIRMISDDSHKASQQSAESASSIKCSISDDRNVAPGGATIMIRPRRRLRGINQFRRANPRFQQPACRSRSTIRWTGRFRLSERVTLLLASPFPCRPQPSKQSRTAAIPFVIGVRHVVGQSGQCGVETAARTFGQRGRRNATGANVGRVGKNCASTENLDLRRTVAA